MVLNRQRGVRVSVASLGKFSALACRTLHLAPESLSVCLVTNSAIARWNRSYRGKPGATDVLSFPAQDAQPNRKPGLPSLLRRKRDRLSYLGDIAIAPAVARRNARRYGRTFNDEMRILILHGILHLMGYDHETDTGQMERRERRLRRTLGLA